MKFDRTREELLYAKLAESAISDLETVARLIGNLVENKTKNLITTERLVETLDSLGLSIKRAALVYAKKYGEFSV